MFDVVDCVRCKQAYYRIYQINRHETISYCIMPPLIYGSLFYLAMSQTNQALTDANQIY